MLPVRISLALALVALPALAGEPAPWGGGELSAGVGALGSGYSTAVGRVGDSFFAGDLAARRVFSRGVTGDLDLFFAQPFASDGPGFTATLIPRVGWTGSVFSIVGGPALQYTPGALPAVQVLPSVRADLWFGQFGLSAGLFDLHALAPADISFELPDFSVGYVAPFGVQTAVRFHLARSLGVKVQAIAFRTFNAQLAMLMASATWGARP